jgi:hypothetical protein
MDLTKSKNGSTKGSASSYIISFLSRQSRTKANLVSPEPINHDLDTNQGILLVLSLDQFDHQTHHARFKRLEWVGVR